MSEIERFRAEVEAFLVQRGWSPTRFGREIAGDPLFVFDLREGREPRADTRERIAAAMAKEGGSPGGSVPLRIGLAGVGTVGAALARILADDADSIARRIGRPLKVTAVSARSRSKQRGCDISQMAWFDDPVALARNSEIDIFVELMGGEDGPALAAVTAALEAGKPVITGNKALLARHGMTLAKLAEANGTALGFEAAVAGGIPVIKTLREALGSARVTRIYGMMNGTCNYILSRMTEERISFAEALEAAQKLGYAEADPSFDVDGFDAAHKLAILTSLCFRSEIAVDEIFVEGIRSIDPADIRVAGDLGYVIKLLGIATRSDDGIEQRVHPTLVPKSSAIASVRGVLNAVALETNHVRELLLAGPGAGGEATAASALADIIDIARGNRMPPLGTPVAELAPYRRAPMRAHAGGYYVRLAVRDIPGALAAIASRMGTAGISLESVIQRPDLAVAEGAQKDVRTVVLITHETVEATIRDTLAQIAGDGFILGTPQLIRIERL
jgi:homoserine dehydrogenase